MWTAIVVVPAVLLTWIPYIVVMAQFGGTALGSEAQCNAAPMTKKGGSSGTSLLEFYQKHFACNRAPPLALAPLSSLLAAAAHALAHSQRPTVPSPRAALRAATTSADPSSSLCCPASTPWPRSSPSSFSASGPLSVSLSVCLSLPRSHMVNALS